MVVLHKFFSTTPKQDSNPALGPIIRIRPDELHIKDSEFYDTLFSRLGKRDKSTTQTQRLGFTKDTFSTAPHDLHRSRRKALLPSFSLQKIDEFQSVIREKVDLLRDVISGYKNGQVLHMERMWTALTSDVISRYAFANSMDHVESPGFRESFMESTDLLVRVMTVGVHFPSLLPILESIPVFIVKKLQPEMQVAFGFKDVSFPAFLPVYNFILIVQNYRACRTRLPRFARVKLTTINTFHTPPSFMNLLRVHYSQKKRRMMTDLQMKHLL